MQASTYLWQSGHKTLSKLFGTKTTQQRLSWHTTLKMTFSDTFVPWVSRVVSVQYIRYFCSKACWKWTHSQSHSYISRGSRLRLRANREVGERGRSDEGAVFPDPIQPPRRTLPTRKKKEAGTGNFFPQTGKDSANHHNLKNTVCWGKHKIHFLSRMKYFDFLISFLIVWVGKSLSIFPNQVGERKNLSVPPPAYNRP